jgi:hypothetical protein
MTINLLFGCMAIFALIITFLRKYYKNDNGVMLTFVQCFLGGLFIFSGIVKAIDPRGTAYKMHDYFNSFSQDGLASFWEMMSHYELEFALAMIIFEIVLGIAVLFAWNPRWSSVGMLWINLFFLLLTGYTYLSGFCMTTKALILSIIVVAIFGLTGILNNDKKRKQGYVFAFILLGIVVLFCRYSNHCFLCEFTATKQKVTDCGCFGDFMKLKPIQTFYKDVLLTFLSVYLVIGKNKIKRFLTNPLSNKIMIISCLATILFAFYNTFWNLPIVDFRPYRIGSDINEKMKVIEPDSVLFNFIYKNKQTGNQQEFDAMHIPTDTNWEFIDRKDHVIREGKPAPINNLRLENTEGVDVTNDLLNEDKTSFWIVSYKPSNTNFLAWKEKIKPFAVEARQKGYPVYALVTFGTDQSFEKEIASYATIIYVDETPLKTMIRSNPGIIKLRKGVVQDMWHWRFFDKSKALNN